MYGTPGPNIYQHNAITASNKHEVGVSAYPLSLDATTAVVFPPVAARNVCTTIHATALVRPKLQSWARTFSVFRDYSSRHRSGLGGRRAQVKHLRVPGQSADVRASAVKLIRISTAQIRQGRED
jgi:hypothetical protein